MSNENNPFQKNLELWQKFSESYTKNMFAIFEKNLEGSKAFQEQVQSAVNQAVDAQFEMVLTGLKTMEKQVGELSKAVSEMAEGRSNGK